MAAAKPTSSRRHIAERATARPRKRWSAHVTAHSDAMTLEKGIFTRSPAAIARSLKRSAERSHRRKASPFRSATSMLNFYINRAGKNLSAAQRQKLAAAKGELRKVFGARNEKKRR